MPLSANRYDRINFKRNLANTCSQRAGPGGQQPRGRKGLKLLESSHGINVSTLVMLSPRSTHTCMTGERNPATPPYFLLPQTCSGSHLTRPTSLQPLANGKWRPCQASVGSTFYLALTLEIAWWQATKLH